jgi:hypothetical protein
VTKFLLVVLLTCGMEELVTFSAIKLRAFFNCQEADFAVESTQFFIGNIRVAGASFIE